MREVMQKICRKYLPYMTIELTGFFYLIIIGIVVKELSLFKDNSKSFLEFSNIIKWQI